MDPYSNPHRIRINTPAIVPIFITPPGLRLWVQVGGVGLTFQTRLELQEVQTEHLAQRFLQYAAEVGKIHCHCPIQTV